MPVPTLMCFNPRPHARGDTIRRFDASGLDVSIHAPTRGATYIDKTHVVKYLVSIHAPTRGGDLSCVHLTGLPYMFQSTPPHEGRLDAIIGALIQTEFQSTPPHEGRLVYLLYFLILPRFQSTPPREGRHCQPATPCYHRSVSIHAPTRGATRIMSKKNIFLPVSIHAPTRGATAYSESS